MDRTIYFLCSPGLGILDSWLPVLWELKKRDTRFRFVCLFPKPSSVDLIDEESILVQIAEGIFDEVIFKTHSNLWVATTKMNAAKKINQSNWIIDQLQRVKRVSLFKPIIKLIEELYQLLDRLRYQKILRQNVLHKGESVLLYDVYEEYKDYNSELMTIFSGVKKFSVGHGLEVNLEPIIKRAARDRKSGETTVYLYSHRESPYYINSFGLSEKELKVVGVPRHAVKWIDFLKKRSSLSIEWKNYIFIISRPISSYLPYERKKRALTEIKELAQKFNLKVVAKRHPKERDDGLFEKVFGVENHGKEWLLTNEHPFIIGKDALLAIAFYSGVVVDMLKVGTPVIEYLDLRDLKEHDHSNALRDELGKPVFSFRKLKLVFGVDDRKALFDCAEKIIVDKAQMLEKLMVSYRELFPSDGGDQKIADDISMALGEISNVH